MRKLNLTLILVLLSFIKLNAQNPQEKNSDEITYQLEFDFSGEVTSSLDSTFIVYCVVDASKIKNYEKLILKTGKNANKLIERQIKFSNNSKVKKKLGKMRIELGKAGEDLSIIDLGLLNSNGEKVKMSISQK